MVFATVALAFFYTVRSFGSISFHFSSGKVSKSAAFITMAVKCKCGTPFLLYKARNLGKMLCSNEGAGSCLLSCLSCPHARRMVHGRIVHATERLPCALKQGARCACFLLILPEVVQLQESRPAQLLRIPRQAHATGPSCASFPAVTASSAVGQGAPPPPLSSTSFLVPWGC